MRYFFADRDGTHAVMREEPYSLFTPCPVYEDSQILPARFTMCLVGTYPTLLQGGGEELVQLHSTEGVATRGCVEAYWSSYGYVLC